MTSSKDNKKEKIIQNTICAVDWNFKWYAVDNKGFYVYGFDDKSECETYCNANGLKIISKNKTNLLKRKPKFLESWTDTYPTKGL